MPENVKIEFAMKIAKIHLWIWSWKNKKNYDKLVLIPLFPQYASCFNQSDYEILRKWWVIRKLSVEFWDFRNHINCRNEAFDLKILPDHILFIVWLAKQTCRQSEDSDLCWIS